MGGVVSAMIRHGADLVAQPADVATIGGKGLGLVSLAALGCDVPPFFVLTTAGWAASGGGDAPPDAVPSEVRDALREALATLGEGPYAVRSSAVVEDGAETSWAGQFESVLGVTADAVPDAVLTCWRSARGERALAYADAHGIAGGAMAVVVQRMVFGQASGVAFSRTPEDPDHALLSVGLGLGEGVVQGIVPCDTFRVDRRGVVTSELAEKDEEVVHDGGAIAARPVTDARKDAPAVPDAVAREVAVWCFRLEEALGRPVDVEFTVADGRPWLVQVRPITVPIPLGRRSLWDNSNIVESYSGITTPLTFTFASTSYTIVYQLFCRVMGVDEATIRRNEPTFRRMIGLVRGRIYYNLNSWYRVLSLLPGFQFNRAAMETMMGVSEVASDEDAGASGTRWVEGLRLGTLLGRLGWRLFRLEADAARFQRIFDATLASARAQDLSKARPDALLALYEEIEQKLLWGWTPPLVNDFFCMIFYKLLEQRCRELTGEPDTQLHNRLVAGEGSLASAAPATDLLAIVRRARDVDGLRAVLVSDGDDDAVLAQALGFPVFAEPWTRWMARFGDRSPDELKLESPSLRDTPEFVLGTIRSWLRDPDRLRAFGDGDGEDRRAAEDEVRRALGSGGGPRGWLRRRLFAFVLGQARRRIAMRESLRLERTRIFGFVRLLFRAFGERYTEAGHLDAPADVFYLTLDEVLGFTRGTTATTDLRGLVTLRRAEFARHRDAPAPAERFHTWGAVHVGNSFAGARRPAAVPVGDALQGTPCSPGIVVAPARVVHDPREVPDLHGGVLCAHRTDPGWVSLFPTASAVVVERGSLLSHSAVVARELGLPAVVGVRGLLTWVADGETIRVDGAAGVVERVAEGSA